MTRSREIRKRKSNVKQGSPAKLYLETEMVAATVMVASTGLLEEDLDSEAVIEEVTEEEASLAKEALHHTETTTGAPKDGEK